MYLKNKNKINGFTIVELLVVIVVIGILATISIVSYSGITSKARETKVINIVKSYQTALQMYATEHGTFPMAGNGPICLGSTDDFTASGDFTEGSCVVANSTPVAFTNNDSNNELEAYMGGSVDGLMPEAHYSGSIIYRGVLYDTNPDGSVVRLDFAIESNTGCPIGDQYSVTDGVYGCQLFIYN